MNLPNDRHEDWECLMDILNVEENQDPDFVKKGLSPVIIAEGISGDGADAKWIAHDDALGDQRYSILRLILAHGTKMNFRPERPVLEFRSREYSRVWLVALGEYGGGHPMGMTDQVPAAMH